MNRKISIFVLLLALVICGDFCVSYAADWSAYESGRDNVRLDGYQGQPGYMRFTDGNESTTGYIWSANDTLYYAEDGSVTLSTTKLEGNNSGSSIILSNDHSKNIAIGVGSTVANTKLYVKAGGTGTGFVLRVVDSSSVDKVTFLDKGYIGIGVTNPGVALEVGDGTGTLSDGADDVLIAGDLEVDDDVRIDGGAITLSVASTIDLAASSTKSLNIEGGLLNLDTTNTRVGIGNTAPSGLLHAGTSPDSGVIILNTGLVGIGNSLPTIALEIGDGTGTLADGADDVLIAGDLEVDDDVQIDGGSVTLGAATNVDLLAGTNSLTFESTALAIDATNKRVGIGGTNPAAGLEIGDTVSAPSYATGAGDLLVSDDVEIDDDLYVADAIAAATVNTTSTITFRGNLLTAGPADGGVSDCTTGQTLLTAAYGPYKILLRVGGESLTLSDGEPQQTITLLAYGTATDTVTITPTTKTGFTTITLNAAGESVTLTWDATLGWYVTGQVGSSVVTQA